jgi:hypothetical protein
VEAVLASWVDLTRSDSTGWRQGTSEVALLSPPNGRKSRRRAAPVRSGAHLLIKESVESAAEAGRMASTGPSTLAEDVERRVKRGNQAALWVLVL